ncbi:MAG: thymidylate synthase [bacterium]
MKYKYYRENHVYETGSQAYLGTLEDVYLNPDYRSAPRGFPIREKVNYMFTVLNPTSDPIVTKDQERNPVIVEYTNKEVALYDSGTNRVEDFEKASTFWRKIANADGTINSAYGFLIWYNKSLNNGMMTPWEWAKQSLIQDKDTRQAILRFSLPEHSVIGTKDFPCTLFGNFMIRENKLNLTIVMRSNDLVLGLVYDLPWFAGLVDRMLNELQSTYPELTKGTYTHLAHSEHIYERDIEKVEKMLGIV